MQNPKTLKLIGLVRVSTTGQADAGTPETQREALRRLADQHSAELTLVEVANVGGGDLALTSEFQREILPRLEAGWSLALYHTDRLIRAENFGSDWAALEAVRLTGAKIYFPGGMRDLGNADDRLFTALEAMFAGREKARIRQRMVDGKERIRRSGRPVHPHKLPLGIGWSLDQGWHYTEDIEIIRQAYQMYSEGTTNLAEIGRASGGVCASTVSGWLRSHIYRGIWRIDKVQQGAAYAQKDGRQVRRRRVARRPEDVIEHRVFSAEDQVVDDATWHRVVTDLERRKGRTRAARTKNLPDIPWTGFLWSAHEPLGPTLPSGFVSLDLGKQPSHIVYGNAGTQKYHCACKGSKATRLDKCDLRFMDVPTINRALATYLEGMVSEGWFREAVLAEVSGNQGKPKSDPRPGLEKQLAQVDKKIQRLVDLYVDGGLQRADFDRRHADLTTERTRVQTALDALVSGPSWDAEEVEAAVLRLTFEKGWSSENKRSWAKRHGLRVRISNQGIESISLRLPGADGLPQFVLGKPMTWADLTGCEKPWDPTSRRLAEGYMARADGCKFLGIGRCKWEYWRRIGKIPPPERTVGGRKGLWRREVIEALRPR